MNEQIIQAESVIGTFDIEGKVQSLAPFGSGHINDTFRVINEVKESPDYLLQRVNHEVFKDVSGMMNNISQVTGHLSKKSQTSQNPSASQETLELIKTRSGALFQKENDGTYWRVFVFKKSLKSYDLVESPGQAYEGAKAFGLFFRLLSDFPSDKLIETIPNFHNITIRLHALKQVLTEFPTGRSREVEREVNYVFSVAEEMCQIEYLKADHQIPLRVTHNDTKFNNVLLDPEDKGVCVIDLDTVMPGVVHYDFGDGIRTSTSTAAEDEPDLGLVHFDINKYEAFADGYLEHTRDILSPIEMKYLGLSGALFAYIMGVRFLTDYVSNDVYYKTSYAEHNLHRAKCQLELSKRIMERMQDLNKIIKC